MAQASPLAQLFQPLIVDDAFREDTCPQAQAGPLDVSYGPASRRRLSSGTMLQRVLPTNREQENDMVATSGERTDLLWEPETAEETREKESTLGSLEWARRLDGIEKRQKRMEELLGDILAAVGGRDERG